MAPRLRRPPACRQGQGLAQGHPGLDGRAGGQAQAAGRRRRLHRRGAQAGERQDCAQGGAAVVEAGCGGDAQEWDRAGEGEAVIPIFVWYSSRWGGGGGVWCFLG